MADPWGKDGMSVTLKQDGREGTWIVFHGTPESVKTQISGVFNLDTDVPLYDLINEATRLYKASANVNSGLGGRTIPPRSEAPGKSGSAWERVGSGNAAPAEPEVDPNVARLEKAIEEATSVPALKEIYARDSDMFQSNLELFAVWKAKGKSLS